MQIFIDEITRLVKRVIKEPIQVEIPPVPEFGDFALPCFKFTKTNPVHKAQEIAKAIKPSKLIDVIEAKGPYVNFYVNKEALARIVLTQIWEQDLQYGKGAIRSEKVMVEFSQPNTHKAFHIGHLRNVCLGDALVRIMRYSGYPVIAANYINDTGAHVSKCIWAYLKFFKGKEPLEGKGEWLGQIYAHASKQLEENPEYKQEVDYIHQQIEKSNPEFIEIWETTKEWSMDDFFDIYKKLQVHFDAWFFDNELIEPGKVIVQELVDKSIAIIDQGATIVDLNRYKLDVALILKADGTSLYVTKDLALAKQKFEQFKIDKSIYVVAAEQSMHFKQLFKILEIYGFSQAKKCYHLSYELVMLKEGKMSSRAGNIVLYSEFASKVESFARSEVDQRHSQWSAQDKDVAVHQVTLGAIKFGMIYQDANKVITFDPQKSIDFTGETGPYCQYAHARTCSVLKKSPEQVMSSVDFSLLSHECEIELIKLLGRFPLVVATSSQTYTPSILCRYVLDVSQAFNDFYETCPIIKAEDKIRHARLNLLNATRVVLRIALALLGIPAPEQM
ncbi:MAG: arginine--tRNA ligase [Nanoarchaeota archaeon]